MKTFKIVAITILSLGFLSAAALFLVGYFKVKPGGILVDATPSSDVYINGSLVGKTPYEGTFDPEIISVRIVPSVTEITHAPYEAKASIVSGFKTVIRREFGETEETSSGDIISFEKEGGRAASLVVISDPDNAQVSIDGAARGFTPYKSSNASLGEHQVAVKALGYTDRTVLVKTTVGYKLAIYVKLAKAHEEPKIEAAKTEVRTYVEILDTPTGFLRVRSEPGSAGREIHQVSPGEKYLFLEEDAASGWFKIQLEAPTAGLPEGRSGWVSNQYSKKIEEEVEVLPQTPVTETPE